MAYSADKLPLIDSSKQLRQRGLQGVVMYNNVLLPAYLHVETDYTPVMDRANRTLECLKITVKVTGMIISGALRKTKGGTTQTAPPAVYEGLGAATSEDRTVDLDIDEAKKHLTTPGRHLIVAARGVGGIVVMGYRSSTEYSSLILPWTDQIAYKSLYTDVRNGPVVTKCNVKPVANGASMLDWEVVCHVVPCENIEDRDIRPLSPSEWSAALESPESDAYQHLLSLVYSTSVTVEQNLTSSVNVSGTIRLITERRDPATPLTEEQFRAKETFLRKYITQKLFPKIPNHKRTSQFTLSEDKTELAFSIQDVEIPSDNPYPVGFADLRATHKTSSGLEGKDAGGFNLWSGEISVEGEVYPGFSKLDIWRVFTQITNTLLSDYAGKAIIRAPDPTGKGADDAGEEDEPLV